MKRPASTISIWLWTTAAVLAVVAGCTNPFAPRLDSELSPDDASLGDQRTVDGVFQNIKYAYNYRDTLIYSNLLHPEFQFRYYDPERATFVSFNRDTEMRITNNLFRGASQIDLSWNTVLLDEGDSLQRRVTRSYDLKITLQANESFRIDGRATLNLVRNSRNDVWLIKTWSDDSNF